MSVTILFILFGMYFIHTVETDADILLRVDELDQLLNWAIELSDDVLHSQHHTQIMSPCITAVAARTVMRIFFTSLMVILPACCTCWRLRL